MKAKLLITVILFTVSLFLFSDEPPKPVLEKGDVKNFIKTFPLLQKEFKKFGVKYEAKQGAVTFPTAVKASQEFLEILKKHGWDEHFFHKMSTILLGYSSIAYGDAMKKADPEMEKAIKQIEANQALSQAMKDQLKQQLMMTKGVMKTQGEALKKTLNKADLDLIKPLVEDLKKVLEKK
jgi:hypothetical protein